ncbi:MAG: hypothetical protein Tsb0021_13440 [Chlamydiales bacterium]
MVKVLENKHNPHLNVENFGNREKKQDSKINDKIANVFAKNKFKRDHDFKHRQKHYFPKINHQQKLKDIIVELDEENTLRIKQSAHMKDNLLEKNDLFHVFQPSQIEKIVQNQGEGVRKFYKDLNNSEELAKTGELKRSVVAKVIEVSEKKINNKKLIKKTENHVRFVLKAFKEGSSKEDLNIVLITMYRLRQANIAKMKQHEIDYLNQKPIEIYQDVV